MKRLSLPLLLTLATSSAAPSDTELGELIIEALKPGSSQRITASEAREFQRLDLAQSLDLLPGVSATLNGARAESMVTVRGFDLRQVPLHIDGIPVYVPYDGYADLGRFMLPGSAEIEVAKSISPTLAGPNALGGLINVFSRRPTSRLEGSLTAGAFSGDGWQSALHAGGREEFAYWTFNVSWLEQSAFPLSDDFRPVPTEDGGRRENSWREDWHFSGRIAWTPHPDDEYALGFRIQRGSKGNPPYTGSDPAIRPRYWQWPYWDKDTIYVLTRTSLGPDTTLETRWHYDRFENLLRAFDDATYTTQDRPSSFNSYYDDWIAGFSSTLENLSLESLRLAAALHFQRDHHKEWNRGAPSYRFEDDTASIGAEAELFPDSKSSWTLGISHDWKNIRQAVDTNTGFPLDGDRTSSWNPQLVWNHEFSDHLESRLGVSRKSRFPTIKDRYSYRLGQAIPNPDLRPETAAHFDAALLGSSRDRSWKWELNAFISRIHDAIQRVDSVASTPAGSPLFQLRNVGEVRHHGLELSVDRKWNDSLETGLRYAWTRARNRTEPDIRIIGVPEHEFLSYAKLHLHPRLRLIPSFTWADSRFVTSTGTTVGHYSSFDAVLEADLTRDLMLHLGATNLFDRHQSLDEGYPAPGRTLYASLRYEF